MARRNRYREMEKKMTYVLLGNAAVFVLYMIFAASGIIALKVITAIVAILVSLLCLGYLYMNGEIRRRRSLWMATAAAAVLLCTLVSLILNFPAK